MSTIQTFNSLPFLSGDRIIIHLINASDLIPSDANGLSDPYVLINSVLTDGIEILEKPIKSKIVMKNLNPTWNEIVKLPKLKNFTQKIEISFIVMDFDRLTRDDFLGECKYIVENSLDWDVEELVEINLEKVERGRIKISVSVERDDSNKLYEIERQLLIHNHHSNSKFTIHTVEDLLHFECPKSFKFNNELSTSESFLLESSETSQLVKVSILPAALHTTFEKSKKSLVGLSLLGFSKESNFLKESQLTNLSDSYRTAFSDQNRVEFIERVSFQYEKDSFQYCGHCFVLKLKEFSSSFASIIYCEKNQNISDDNNNTDNISISLEGEVLINFIISLLELKNSE